MTVIDIFVARHGQTAANAAKILQGGRINPPLNEYGLRQANALAEAMKDEKLDWIVTSGLDRAIETANCVAKYHEGSPLLSDSRLNEVSWGELDGGKFVDIDPAVKPVIQKWNDGDFDAKVNGGESANDGKARALEAFADILKVARERKYRKVFVCIHGRIARVVMAMLVDKDLSRMKRFPHTNCSYHQIRVEMDDDATSAADPEKLTFELVRMDVRDHLADLDKIAPNA